jgi:DNA repair protein RadC
MVRRRRRGKTLSSPRLARDFLFTKLSEPGREVMVAVLADARNRLIEYVDLFRGLRRVSIHTRSYGRR